MWWQYTGSIVRWHDLGRVRYVVGSVNIELVSGVR